MRVALFLVAAATAALGASPADAARGERATGAETAAAPARGRGAHPLSPSSPAPQVPDTVPPRVRLGLSTLPLPFATVWPVAPGADDPWLGGGAGRLLEAAEERLSVYEGAAGLHRFAADAWARELGRVRRGPFFLPDEPAAAEPDATGRPEPEAAADEPLDLVSAYTDLGVRVVGRAELGGDWTRYRPCDDQFQVSCNPNVFPRLNPEMRFGVEVGGSVSERFHVDVDFDQMREFDAANTINLYYEGTEDEIVRRLEVGDVTFRLPRSRFLTEGIPAGNFGFQATGQVGPMDFRAVWAEQKGDLTSREFRLQGVGGQRGFVQEDTLVLDDADYASGQFFFLVDPAELLDYPHVDVLSLDGSEAPATVAPGLEPVQLYRYEDDPVQRQQVEGYIQAEAVAGEGAGRVEEAGWFRQLQAGLDYYVHPSGLWVALRNPLRRDEMLAVTYVTAAGDTVGDYNPELVYNSGGRPRLELLKAAGASHQPGRPTWEMEMHNVYRVSGSSDVDPGSVELTISLGELSAGRTFKRGPAGEDLTFLRLFGLDQESPTDVIDGSYVYRPAQDVFEDQPPVQGTFIVFPTLRPFLEPPPLPTLGLTAADTREVLGNDVNRRIYESTDPFERDNGALFRLTIPYRVRSEGVISSFSLGALGIREGSERIVLGDRVLVNGVDYEIDYDVGQVTLSDPEALFAATPDAPVRATWEQKQIFRTAPTSVFGLAAHYDLAGRGGVDVLGLYQSEKTLVNRPQLGVEPGAVALGGLNAAYATEAPWLDRLLDRVPALRFAGESSLSVNGELAVSAPRPNTRGAVFVDDFDATAAIPLSLLAPEWDLGAAPASAEGAEGVLPPSLGPESAGQLVWQHAWILQAGGDSVGVHEGFLPRVDIDQQIRVAGSQIREPGLRLTFRGRGLPSFRSITTTLSPTGIDLTRSEFVEFYAAGDGAALVVDLGVVSEDALFIDESGATTGVDAETGEPWGLGLLDQEADPRRGEVWGNVEDQRGLWGETCQADRGKIYLPGDPRANCTRGNGRRDTEDLDGDGTLDSVERHLRYVVPLGPASPFLARTTDETGTDFRLYRIPIQDPRATEVGGAFTEGDLRSVKHLRLTVVAGGRETVTLARMRISGSRWIRRGLEGVLAGIVGDTAALGGRVEVSEVSRVTEGEAYDSPPGVLEQLQDPTQAFGGQGIEFNEKSLGIRFEDLEAGDRVEVYHRFPQRPRSFLTYREARLWVAPRSGDFGPDRDRFFFLKVGTDDRNFYLFRTRLDPPSAPAGVTEEDWRPERVVDFGQWLDLRRRAERILISNPPLPGDPPLAVWSADSTYALVLEDRGRAPDLANVREMSLGVWNEGGVPFSGEVWVDELRLSGAVEDAGMAGHLAVDLAAADVLDARLTVSGRGAFFRQLEEEPTYQEDRFVSMGGTLRLERFAPADWGVEVPLTVSHDRTSQDPTFLANSDLRADRLGGVRETGARQTRVSVGFRKRTPSANPVLSALLDGLEGNVGWYSTSASTITSEQASDGLDARVGYARRLARRDFGLVPGFLEPVVRALLPGFLEDRVVDSRLRWSPERIAAGTTYRSRDHEIRRFDRIIELPTDTGVTPSRAPRETMESVAELGLRPLSFLGADVTFLSTRDLLDPARAVADPAVQALIREERARLGGLDLGWETRRDLRTRVDFRPRIVDWLRHDVTWTTRYLADRNANFVLRRELEGDTAVALLRSADGQRDVSAVASLDAGGLVDDVLGPTEGTREGMLPAFLNALRPVTATWQDGITARFHRDPVDPGSRFQLGLGGVEDFRFMDGDTAATLTDRTRWTLGSGILLPGWLSVDLAYERTRAATLDTRSDRTIRSETWPDLTASIPDVTIPGVVGTVLRRVTLSSGVRRTFREVDFGADVVQRRTDDDVMVPFDLTFRWAGDLVTSYRGTFRTGEGVDPTGDTERDRTEHRVTVTSSLVAPSWVPLELDRPLRLSVIFNYQGERDCRTVAGRETCVAFLDQLNRSLGLTLGTSVSGFEMGLQASYTNRQSFVGLQTASTQFQLGLWGQFLFEAGRFAGGGVGGG